jgi:hypothetical protein
MGVGREVTVLASFTLPEDAEACQAALRRAGLDVVQVAPLSSGPDGPTESALVEWGRYGYQPDVLDDKWTAASAWDHGGLIWGQGWLLTAVVPDEAAERARDIIRRYGGHL